MNLSRILFVEVENDIRAIGRMALEMVGKFTVRACGSGVASLPRHASVRDLLVAADQTLYRAKREGKNCGRCGRDFRRLKGFCGSRKTGNLTLGRPSHHQSFNHALL
jgi:hypothetical protein